MAELQSGEGHMMINPVVWAQYINVTDRQTGKYIAIATAAVMHYATGGKKLVVDCVSKGQIGQITRKYLKPFSVTHCMS